MKNDRKKSKNSAMAKVIINIHGDNNQILPNATEAVQNFYATGFSHDKKQECLKEEEDEAVRIARGTLCIYYSDEVELDGIIARIGDCRSASDLANLVVNDMHKHTILTSERMVGKDFIEALQQFLTFKLGASTGNIRAQINKVKMNNGQRGGNK